MNTSKIIRGVVNSGRYTVTAPIVKEDYGLYLKIEGVELPSTYEVDFSNSENNGTSVTMIGNADGVLIPHQFIDTGKDIFAFLYHVGADYGRTVYKFRIPNKVRPDRTNEEPTPEEQSTIDQAISALNEAVAKTAQDVVDAEASAQAAGYDADRAEEARSASLDYAEQAEASAISAEQSATASANSASASANSASQSAQIKADVEELVDDAQASADASERSASNAYTYATSAERSSVNASASAQSASGYASQAQSSANTASAKAQDASQSATTASEKASESAQSATNAQGYAQTAESAKTDAQTAQGLAESARDTAVQAKTDAESAKADAESARDEAQQAVASISGALAEKAPVITDTASGSIASFPDGADGLPLKSLIVDINPVQDLSNGDPSPENICPINGWTQVDVEQSGKNVWDEEWLNGYYNTSGNFVSSANYVCSKNMVRFDDNETLYLVAPVPLTIRLYDENKNYLGSAPSTWRNETIKPTKYQPNARYLHFFNAASDSMTTYNHDISINYPSTDHDYHPYTGRSITIDLGQTVYGGKLDVLSGVLTVDRAMVDLGMLTWNYIASNKIFSTNIDGKKPSITKGAVSQYTNGGWWSEWADKDCVWCGNAANAGFVVKDTRFADTVTFKSAMSGVQFCYELAEPIEIQLSPNQINSLYGVNNLWADSGDTEVVYREDTKLFIERLTAPDSADMIADANITSGQYFMVGNSLYKATANIANGASIIVGTNCIRKSLSEALNEINA